MPRQSIKNTKFQQSIKTKTKMFVTLLLLSQLFTSVYGIYNPYFLVFRHHTANVLQCTAAFTKIRNAIFADYVKDLIATTNFTRSMATRIDSNWAAVSSNQTVTTTGTVPTQNTRNLRCGGGVCGDSLSVIIQRRCCDACNKNCRRRRNLLRQLQTPTTQPILDIEPIRNNTTGYIIVENEGDRFSSNTTGLPGAKIAAQFYTNVQTIIPPTDPCNAILLETKYRALEMTVVRI
jgi:hypothetical protein